MWEWSALSSDVGGMTFMVLLFAAMAAFGYASAKWDEHKKHKRKT